METLKGRLSLGVKVGYGVASIADATAFDFIAGFLLFFLSDIAGISPAFAGTIIFIAIIWDAITDPIIGMWSDKCKSKYGRRRPFILGSAIPLGISIALLFIAVDFSSVAKNMYYLIIVIIFWTSYTVFNIPYQALGACLTFDNDERTRIQSIRQFFNYIGLFCASAVPAYLIGTFIENGIEEKSAWFYTAAILGAVITITILITWRATRGKEIVIEEEETVNVTLKQIVKEVKDVLKLKTYLIIIIAVLFYNMNYTILVGNSLFYANYILGISEAELSIVFVILTIAGIILSLAFGYIAVKFDKRNVLIACLSFTAIVMIGAKFVGVYTLEDMMIYMGLYSIGSAAYWTLIFTLLYDVVEVDEFKTGNRREGIIVSYFSFFVKLGAAVAAQIAGLILQFSGYNYEAIEQTPEAIDVIESLGTLYPGILMLLCAITIMIFPITREKHKALVQAIEFKKEGKPYSTEGFKSIL